MAIKLNSKGNTKARSLIKSGNVDKTSDWGFSAEDGNKLLGANGDDWANYGSFHMGVDSEFDPDTKGHWKYPFGKNGKVYRSGLIAIRQRAAQQNETDIYDAAGKLIEMIDSKKDSKTETHTRVDMIEWDVPKYAMNDSLEETPEGYLKGRAIVTNIGVFTYRMPDGSERRELRLPDHVFERESLDTLKLKPLTDDHPSEAVTAENIKQLQVGNVGEDIFTDSYHVSAPILITDPEAVNKVKEGKRGLSCAYSVDLVEESGVYLGVPYDAIQKNIRYNHVSIVEEGRAGDAARLQLDSVSGAGVLIASAKNNEDKGDDNMSKPMKNLVLDGVEYEAEAEVVREYNRLNKDHQDVQKEASELKEKTIPELNAKLDTANDKIKTLEEKIEKHDSEEVIEKKVRQRLVVYDAAKRAKVEIKGDESELDIKKKVIVKLFPKSEEKVNNSDSESYIDARFEGALESLDEMDTTQELNNDFREKDSISKTPDNRSDSDKAFEEMQKRELNAWNNEKEVK